jgi:hypothetical protein
MAENARSEERNYPMEGVRMRVALCTAALLFASQSMAAMIVIEPDDFAPGQQITSEFATISRYYAGHPQPVYAVPAADLGFTAPTGTLTFGTSVMTYWDAPDHPQSGLFFEFNEPVSSVRVWGMNITHNLEYSLECRLYLVGAGERSWCDGASETTTKGVAHFYDLSLGGLAFDRIALGGYSALPFIFDRLEATPIPEPSTTGLFGLGTLALLLGRRRRDFAFLKSIRGMS